MMYNYHENLHEEKNNLNKTLSFIRKELNGTMS